MAEEAISVLLVGSGSDQEEPGTIMRVISDQKWPPKTGNCPHQSKVKVFLAHF